MPQKLGIAGFILGTIAIVLVAFLFTTQFVHIGPLVSPIQLRQKVEKLSSEIKTLEKRIEKLEEKDVWYDVK